MFKWKKLGRVFTPSSMYNIPWMREFAQAPATLIFDDFIRVYFSCRPRPSEAGQYESYTGFIDLDRNDLFNIINISEDPILPLGKLGTFDEHGVYPTSVIRDTDSIFAYYAGWSRCTSVPFNCSIGLAISHNNGKSFKRIGKGPIISQSIEEPFVISGPKIRKFESMFYLYYIAGTEWIDHKGKPEIIYKIKMATSLTGVTFNKVTINVIPDILGKKECQAGPDVFYYENKYHMYFVYREGLDFRKTKGRGYKIGYAYSEDRINWTRDDKNAGIEYSKEGWDSTMQHYPHVFELDGNHYMLYNGNEFGKYGFGLAKLEKE